VGAGFDATPLPNFGINALFGQFGEFILQIPLKRLFFIFASDDVFER
jgi:hypothetical protein